jgi:CHASE2 domain-containing sensor protein
MYVLSNASPFGRQWQLHNILMITFAQCITPQEWPLLLILILLTTAAPLCPLQAYDQHLNMILGEVEETITTVEIDDETYEEIIKVQTG